LYPKLGINPAIGTSVVVGYAFTVATPDCFTCSTDVTNTLVWKAAQYVVPAVAVMIKWITSELVPNVTFNGKLMKGNDVVGKEEG